MLQGKTLRRWFMGSGLRPGSRGFVIISVQTVQNIQKRFGTQILSTIIAPTVELKWTYDPGGVNMASSMERVTKAELMEKLSHLKDNDFVGVLASAQDGKESPCHEVLILFHPIDNLFEV